jgi:hypothetical protein
MIKMAKAINITLRQKAIATPILRQESKIWRVVLDIRQMFFSYAVTGDFTRLGGHGP